jgi:hypothetical protein
LEPLLTGEAKSSYYPYKWILLRDETFVKITRTSLGKIIFVYEYCLTNWAKESVYPKLKLIFNEVSEL